MAEPIYKMLEKQESFGTEKKELKVEKPMKVEEVSIEHLVAEEVSRQMEHIKDELDEEVQAQVKIQMRSMANVEIKK